VVAVDLNGIAVGADRQFTTAGPVDHYSVSSSSSSVTAGDTYAFAVTAEDSANMTVDDYTGTVHFSLQQADTNASLPVDYTFKGYSTATPTIAGDDGTHGFSATLKKATNQEILANDTATTIGGSLAVTVNPAGLDHLGLAPSTASVSAGDGQSYTAEGFDPFENSLGDVTSATTFAITPDGTCVGASCSATLAGSHTVTGTDTTKTGSATLTVTPASLDHLVLSPATATMTAGSSQVYTAEGFDQYANSRGDVTSSTTFTIAPDGGGGGPPRPATVVGTHTVTGTDGSATGTATLTVTAAPLDHLVLAPATATMGAGGSQTYTAEGFDQYGNDLGDRTALTTFTLDDATGGCTLASCTETKAGSHTVTGTDGGKTGTAALTVTAGPLDHLGLNPASGSIVTGGTETYTAEGFDQYGNDLGDKTTATTFTIAPDGSCTGADCTASVVGPHMVTGTDGAASGTATLTVNAVAAPIVTGINPTTGPDAGGTTVTITGTDLGLASDVKFGTSSVAIISNSSTQIVVKSPTHSAGAFDVTVTTAGGTSATSSADQFTFVSYAETVLADSPATYWRLGESSGSTSSDSSGASHDGTYATGVMLSVTGALTGDGNTAVALDGIAGSIQDTSGAGAPTGSADRSLEIWFKTTTTTSQPIFSYGAGSLSQFSVNLSGSHVLVNDGAETLDFTAGGSLADGAWHHLVVTYDSTTGVMVYLDGSAVGTAQATSGSLATVLDSSGFEVGTDGTGFFNGSLDEAAIYGSALTSGEVAKHYHAGVGD